MIRVPFFPLFIIHLLGPECGWDTRIAPSERNQQAYPVGMAGVQWLDWYGDGSLLVVDVGLACCALEFEAAALNLPSTVRPLAEGGRVVVVVSGTVTDRLAPAVTAIVDAAGQLGAVPTVVSFGACASSGGPYWDSYSVTKGIDQLLEVDVFVPGCPPPPEALHLVLDRLAGRKAA
jgi:NADH-quinone oxidoreductase subunit B